MKRLPACLLCCLVLIALLGTAADIYVATNGSDTNAGTKEKPLASITLALRKARELRRLNDPTIAKGIHIILRGGVYRLHEPVFIRPEDAGTTQSPTYIEAAPNEQPILSGGLSISRWKKLSGSLPGQSVHSKGKLWCADLPVNEKDQYTFRQLWINNVKAVRARSVNGDSMHRILNWNHKEQTCVIPTQRFFLEDSKQVEMFIHQWWAIAVLRIKKMEKLGDSTKLFFHQPESRIQSEHPWPAPWLSAETGNSAFYLSNALPFLDEPGEWFLDPAKNKLYYWPRGDEDLPASTVTAGIQETLVRVLGTADRPVANIYFNGISFQHTGWLRPSEQGHVPHQAGMYMLDAYKLKPAGTSQKKTLENQAWIGRPAAAVEISFADKTNFENCRFEHLASTALDYHKGVHDNRIRGNLFKDIGGTAILAGVFSDEATEIHLPYNPSDEREICDGIVISNNFITNATNEDWGCVGIGAGYVKNATIEHNELEDLSYTGISLGWGWSPASNAMKNNKVIANKIHHYGKHNYDCAGIYTLSAQPGSFIVENNIDSIYKAPYAHLPSHWFYIYADEGSSYFNVKDNWTPSEKFLQNANGPGNQWTNNGPKVSVAVRTRAGLQAPYLSLLSEKSPVLRQRPINEERPAVIELIADKENSVDIQKLKDLLHQNKADTNAVYQWKNHFVIFDKLADVSVMQGKLQGSFPGVTVKAYHDLFYDFNRKQCVDTSVAENWDHVLMTADLVPDKKLQNEYLDLHRRQPKEWPEVSNGFCNAGFQQLLMYRNGNRLILVISIPKGESLDKLNPKTSENNPRMDQWNSMMRKYQQGTQGTAKSETWVLLKALNR
jgi:hypothetical protein